MIDLTIDTCVLVDASLKGEACRAVESVALLKEYDRDPLIFLAIDVGGFILHEYNANLNASMFGAAWLARYVERFRRLKIAPLPHGLRARLDQLHFSIKDRRFVQVALCTDSRMLVTRDPDFSPEIQRVLAKEAGIRVADAKEALGFLRARGLYPTSK